MSDRPKVGEILVKAGVIDRFQLQSALGEQTRWGRRLGVTLIKLGFVEERDLVRALASQLDVPVARLEGKRIQPEILELVPLSIAEQHMVMPLFTKHEAGVEVLFLGMEDPSDLAVLDDLSFRTGMKVRPVMVGPSEIAEAIDRYYHRPANTATEMSSPAPPAPVDTSSGSREDGESTAPLGVVPDVSSTASATIASGTEELARHWTLASDEDSDTTQPQQQATLPGDLELEAQAPVDPEPPLAVETAPEPPPVFAETAPVTEPSPSAPPDTAYTTVSKPDARTRLILKALTHLLIEKGVMTRDELHARVRELDLTTGEQG